MAIGLLGFLDQAWEDVRGAVREDFDHIATAFNVFSAKLLTTDGYLRKGVIKSLLSGDATNATRVITNTGDGILVWDLLDLSNGVKNKLTQDHVENLTTDLTEIRTDISELQLDVAVAKHSLLGGI